MVKKKLPVRWSPKAEQRLDGIYDHIAEDSVSAARYVKRTLVQLGGTLVLITDLNVTTKRNFLIPPF